MQSIKNLRYVLKFRSYNRCVHNIIKHWIILCSINKNYRERSKYNCDFFTSSFKRTYSFTQIECPIVSDYKKYGELHILRCSLEGPILTPSYCEPVTIECGKCCGDVLVVNSSIL